MDRSDISKEIGIKAEIFRIAEYKTGANMFTEDKMTPPHEESLQALLDDIYSDIIEGIARNRKLKPETIKRAIENSTFITNDYLKMKY